MALRVSSFNKSFSVGSADSDENGSPFLNQFTTVGKSYGKSLARLTSPTKTFAPLPVSAPVSNWTLEPLLELEDHSIETHPPLQAPTSPTAARRELKTSVAADDGGADGSTRGIASGVDSPVTGDRTRVTLPTGNPSGRGLRSSKRDRGKDSKAKELSGDGSTPKRRRA
jgi:hypothetical protein